ncbi:MAG: hypothetical protein ACI974_001732, partial [Paraglaciecola sp.]
KHTGYLFLGDTEIGRLGGLPTRSRGFPHI